MSTLTIALSKGRIFEEAIALFAAAGIAPAEDPETSRKLIIGSNRPDVRFVIVRASDVPTYVQHGAADLGVAGKDVLLEHGGDGLYQPIDLGIGRCRLVIATKRGFDYAGVVKRGARLRVATKYVATAREHFAAKGMGWSRVRQIHPHPLWRGIADATRFYFAHSYHPVPADPALAAGTTDYPTPFTCAIASANIFAVQFHPEKSHRAGLQLLANFVTWNGRA